MAEIIDFATRRAAREEQPPLCWTCPCGCQLLFALKAGVECSDCGNFWEWAIMDGLDVPKPAG